MSRRKNGIALLAPGCCALVAVVIGGSWGCTSNQQTTGAWSRVSRVKAKAAEEDALSPAPANEQVAWSYGDAAADVSRGTAEGPARVGAPRQGAGANAIAPNDASRPTATNAEPTSSEAALASDDAYARTSSAPRSSAEWPTHLSDSTMLWQAVAFPTGDPATSAIGIEKGYPREVRPIQPFNYDIVVTNLTAQRLDGVEVTDHPDENLALTGSVPQGRVREGLYIWTLGGLEPRESRTVRVTAVATAEGAVASTASVTYASPLRSTFAVVSPRLELTASGPAEVLACDEIVYRYDVENAGSGTARAVAINVTLPPGLRTASGESGLEFAIGDLRAGEVRTVSARLRADRAGRFESRASATSGAGPAAESADVTTVVLQPLLEITKECPSRVYVGMPMRYVIEVRNTGDGPARDTVVEDLLPTNAHFVSASDGAIEESGRLLWRFGTLPAGGSRSVEVELNPYATGSFRATALVRAECLQEPLTANCETEVAGVSALLLEVADAADPVRVGENVTYVVSVINQGSATATNVRITCVLEESQQTFLASGATTAEERGNQLQFEPLPALEPRDKATWRIEARAAEAGDVRFLVILTSDQLTRPVEEEEATNQFE